MTFCLESAMLNKDVAILYLELIHAGENVLPRMSGIRENNMYQSHEILG